MPYLTIEKRAKIFTEFGGKSTNTGSIEGQVALLTTRINEISEHLKSNKKDFIIMKAIIFPGINILWMGCILMIIGSLLAVRKRIRKNSTVQKT